MNTMYVLMVYSIDREYKKQIGKSTSSLSRLEKSKKGLDDRLDLNNFFSVIEKIKDKE